MDLYRVVTAAGDTTKELPKEEIKEFLDHADEDFEKIEPTERENVLRKYLHKFSKELYNLQDPHKRLRWTENIMTVRCKL